VAIKDDHLVAIKDDHLVAIKDDPELSDTEDHSVASPDDQTVEEDEVDPRMQMAGALFGSLFNMLQDSQNDLAKNESEVTSALDNLEKENRENFFKIRGDLQNDIDEKLSKFHEDLRGENSESIRRSKEDFKEEISTFLTSPSILLAILLFPGFTVFFQLFVFCKDAKNTLPCFCFMIMLFSHIQGFEPFYTLLFGIVASIENLKSTQEKIIITILSLLILCYEMTNILCVLLIATNILFEDLLSREHKIALAPVVMYASAILLR